MSKWFKLLAAVSLGSIALPATAQYASNGYNFLQAVRERDGNKATELLKAPGSTVVNYRDDKGDAALHIVAGRRDLQWLGYLIGQNADVNIGNRVGDTPLIVASRIGFVEGVDVLLQTGAQVDKPNRQGETALIVAVQQKQMPVIRRLIEAGASADKTDNATGRSARDYARLDARGPEILKILDSAKAKKPAVIAGPKL